MRHGLGFHNRHSAGGFNPASLFAGGIQGFWYDPSDLTTLFQDSAGTTPVTAVEQPVGLMLDKSKGLTLGSELVTNGDFSQGTTGWLLAGTSPTVVNGEMVFPDGVYSTAYQFLTGYQNQWVVFEFDLTITSGTFYAGNYGGSPRYLITTSGRKKFIYYATNIGFEFFVLNTVGAKIDNVTIRTLVGNHAYQSTSASRPTLRARYNLLTYSEEFNDAAWFKQNASATQNAGVAPDGTTTADKLLANTTNGVHQFAQTVTIPNSPLLSVYAKADGYNWIFVTVGGGTNTGVWFDVLNGAVGTKQTNTSGASITPAGNGWWRCSFTVTNIAGAVNFSVFPSNANNVVSFAGDGTSGVLAWGAQLVPTAVFPSNTYQRVGAATDYATGAAFPVYLAADGIDDGLLTNSIDFTGTDKMLVVAGVTKNSDAAVGTLVELSANNFSNNGAFGLFASLAASANYEAQSRGTAWVYARASGFTAPITNIVTSMNNIGGDNLVIRVNGTQSGSDSGDQGTGNYGNYPLYIGRRNNASFPLNGNLYSLIIAGQSYSSGQISSTESWVAAKTPLGTI